MQRKWSLVEWKCIYDNVNVCFAMECLRHNPILFREILKASFFRNLSFISETATFMFYSREVVLKMKPNVCINVCQQTGNKFVNCHVCNTFSNKASL